MRFVPLVGHHGWEHGESALMRMLHVVVRGRVQGVGFRWFVRETRASARTSRAGCATGRTDRSRSRPTGDEACARAAPRALANGPAGRAVAAVDDLRRRPATSLARPFTHPPMTIGHDDEPLHELAERSRASLIRDVPDFPKPGILFKDITPLLADADALRGGDGRDGRRRSLDERHHARRRDREPRASSSAAPVAQRLGAGFVPVRKPGKLPAQTRREEYALEYGTDALEIHADACGARSRAC